MPMADPSPADPATLAQIRRLPHSIRPVVVCDVDEVVLHFIRHLEIFLDRQGFAFAEPVYRLKGNIRRRDGSLADDATVQSLIAGFFEDECGNQQLVDGAAEALDALSASADIVLLTNLPGAANRPVRQRLLAEYGIAYPLVTNVGPKGGAVAAIASGRSGPLVFIDDSPLNIRSVRASLAGAVLVHFVADPRFLASCEPIEGVGLKTNDWAEVRTYIEALLQA